MAVDVRVPDIGDFADVPVIEVLVKPGDRVKKNDSLVVLESDKASMEVPSSEEGVVEDVRVQPGDKVSQGSVIVTLASAAASDAPPDKPQPAAQQPAETKPAQPKMAPTQTPAPQTQSTVELAVPDIGDFADVPVIEVLIKPGDTVAKNDSIVVLESEKASMEVPASAGGVVHDVRVKPGDKVSKGSIIATIAPAEEPRHPEVSKGSARGEGASIPQHDIGVAQHDIGVAQHDIGANGAVHASPSIRRFARELGVDLHGVKASGPNGRVTREDVQRYVKTALQSAPAGGAAANGAGLGLAPWPTIDFAQFGPIERKPLSRIKKISGPNLHRNWVMIPHVTQNDDADVTDAEAFRKELNQELAASGVKVTMLAFLIKASIAALKKFPEFNSSLDGDELVLKNYYHIGFAADTPGGLVVPVVRDADKKGIADLARETSELAAKARDGKLGLAQMQGGTFTISSLGSIGGTYFTPIINAPEVAILGACRAATRPVWNGKRFVPRLIQPLSLSYDHRVIDGAAAARFTAYLAEVLADLRRALI